jgi:serine/threonine protein phosphatase PrpC
MEDAHIVNYNFAPNVACFGVFDGHGGKEVAEFSSKFFIKELQNNKNFINKNYEESLKETFLRMDELLNTEEGKKELSMIKSGTTSQDTASWNQESYAGCTANVILIVDGTTIYCANAGDSRSLLS